MMNSVLQLVGMFFKIITKITNLRVKSSLPEGGTKDSMILSGKIQTCYPNGEDGRSSLQKFLYKAFLYKELPQES